METLIQNRNNLGHSILKDFRSLCLHHETIAGKYEHIIHNRGGKPKTKKKDEEEETVTNTVNSIYDEVKDEALKRLKMITNNTYPDFTLIMQIVSDIVYRRRLKTNQRDIAAVASLLHKSFLAVHDRTSLKLHPIFSEGVVIDQLLKEYTSSITMSSYQYSRLSALARSISQNFTDPVTYMSNTKLKFSTSNPPSVLFVIFMLRLPGLEDLLNRLDYTRFVREAREGRISQEFIFLALIRLSDTSKMHIQSDSDEVLRIKLLMMLKSIGIQFREGNFQSDSNYDNLEPLYNMNYGQDFNEANIYYAITQLVSYSSMLIGEFKNCDTYSAIRAVPIVEFIISKHSSSLLPTINTSAIGHLTFDVCSNKISVVPTRDHNTPYSMDYHGNMSPFMMNENIFPNIAARNSLNFLHINGLITISIKRYDSEAKTSLFLACPNPCRARRVNLSHVNVEEELMINNRTYRLVGAVCLDLGSAYDGCGSSCDMSASQNDIIGTIGLVRAEGVCSQTWLEYRTTWTSSYVREQIERIARKEFEQTTTYSSYEEYKKDNCSGYEDIRTRFINREVMVSDIEVSTSYAMSAICERGMLLFYSEGYEAFAKSIC